MKLVFTAPEFAGKVFPLPSGTTTVGRAPDNMLVLQSASVSSHHCEILVHDREVIVRDHGSANGTWVGGTRVTGQRPVHNHETVRFGTVEARMEYPEAPPAENTGVNELTAVHLHLKAVRNPEPTTITQAPPHVVLAPNSAPEDAERTMVMPGVVQHQKEEPQTAPPPQAATPSNRRAWFMWLVVFAVAGVLVWWKFLRK